MSTSWRPAVSKIWTLPFCCAAHSRLAAAERRTFFSSGHEINCHLKIDIGLEQGQSHLPHSIVDIGFTDRSVTAEILENILKLFTKLRKHKDSETAVRLGYA